MAKINDYNVNEKQKKLISLLKSYPHPHHDSDQFKGMILCTVLAADEYGWTDEFVRICEENPNADFGYILKLIYTEERFPPLEIVYDDEDFED